MGFRGVHCHNVENDRNTWVQASAMVALVWEVYRDCNRWLVFLAIVPHGFWLADWSLVGLVDLELLVCPFPMG